MKAQILLLLSLLAFAISCQSDGVPTVTEQRLYRQWRLTESHLDDSTSIDYSASGIEFITFEAPGIILYGKDKRDAACCNPRSFFVQEKTLVFKGARNHPLPSFVDFGACAAVLCAPIPDSWTIVELTADKLVLKTGRETRTYQAV